MTAERRDRRVTRRERLLVERLLSEPPTTEMLERLLFERLLPKSPTAVLLVLLLPDSPPGKLLVMLPLQPLVLVVLQSRKGRKETGQRQRDGR